MSLAQNFLSKSGKEMVLEAVSDAEKNSSGEIRLHIEDSCDEDVLDHAAFIFEKLEMHKTKLRNGVLFYVSIEPHGFAILGDVGINQKVADDFWDKIKDHVIGRFKNQQYAEGLSEGIIMAGEQLKAHFPYSKNDLNELTDDISFGDS